MDEHSRNHVISLFAVPLKTFGFILAVVSSIAFEPSAVRGQSLSDPLVEEKMRQLMATYGSGQNPDTEDLVSRYKSQDIVEGGPDSSRALSSQPDDLSQPSVPSLPSWLPADTIQRITRPTTNAPKPFGYDLFLSSDKEPEDPYAPIVPEDYRIGVGDHLLVKAWGRVDLDFELVTDRGGDIFIPKAGQVKVAGLTLDQTRKAIRARLEGVYSEFQLSVSVGQLRTFRVFVFGEARRPGAYTVSGAATLIDALYRAGGPNDRGTLRGIRLVRGDTTRAVDLYDFLLSGARNEDPRLSGGDVIFVDVAGPRIAVRGQVKRSGIYELAGATTLNEAIALAGGLEADAYRDRIMIDRLQDVDGRKLIDVNLADDSGGTAWSTAVCDGDDISVFSMVEARPNVIWLEGYVKHPGAFERTDSMTVSNLINGGDQLLPDSYLLRGDLIRKRPGADPELMAVDLQAVLVGRQDADMILQDGDHLVVYSRDEVERPRSVAIEGEVYRPGEYQLFESMRLSDLVFRAGNPTREARIDHVEVVRKMKDGTTHTIECDLHTILNGDTLSDILLEDKDMVFVRRDPDIGTHRLVYIDGEVQFPGRYSLKRDDESFYEILQRAGGLTGRAFPQGIVFIRDEISKDIQRQNLGQILVNAQPLVRDSTGKVYREELLAFDPSSMTRIVLDAPRILKDRGGESDVVMRPGDRVIVPALPSGVQVLGAVASSGTIRFHRGWKVKDYIERAGGTTSAADFPATRLVRADGQVIDCDKRNLKVELGDAVFVPPRVGKKTDWLKTLTQAVSVVGGVATTYLVVQAVGQ